jgi:hypothetical protein
LGRRKKSNIEVELENEMPVEEAAVEEPSESEWEAEEAESLSAESDEKEPAAMEAAKESDDSETEEEKTPAKPKRQRRSRKKAPEIEAADSEEPSELETQPEEPAEEVAPKKAARGKKKNDESSDISPVFQQWKTLQEITASMAANFERIHRQMNDLQGNYLETAERLAKQAPSKPPVMTKVAMGVAMFSVVISLLSLSFAQSVRNNIVETTPTTPRVAQSTHVAGPADAPSSIAVGSRKRHFGKTKK